MKTRWIVTGCATALGMFAIAFSLVWLGRLPYPAEVSTLAERGAFGDSFGAFNAVVSAFGFMGLLITLAFQQRQLTLQSNELRQQSERDAEGRRRDEVAQFEQLLFRLLELYQASVDGVRLIRRGKEYTGRDALTHYLACMQAELRKRKLHAIQPALMAKIEKGNATDLEKSLLDYVASENCRVLQYTIGYQRRVAASLLALLRHLEKRCPDHADLETYRAVVSAQITHVETQYIFGLVLIYENQEELRTLLDASGLFRRDSPPYNFKLHQMLYQRFWGLSVGDASKARKLAVSSKPLRALLKEPDFTALLRKHGIALPMRPEALNEMVVGEPPSD